MHRDIKPSNVLVTLNDGKPVPKVIDFGVAKALNTRLTERTIYTAHMQVIGTLMYMSPEQAEMSGLDVDTRADVYGLGVLLYELLTGTTPFLKEDLDQAGFDEQRRIIREKEPPRASLRISSLGETATTIAEQRKTDARKLHQQVRGDLDWIVMKALEKDRTRRYETASGFAADVQRFLCDEPIEARPPSTRYRLRKLASRHRTALAATLVVASALLTSAILSTWQATIAYQERGAALLARRQAEEARVGAERGEKRANDTAVVLKRTLLTLQTELLDRALGDALAGDIVHSDYSLARAQQAGASEDLIRVIRGLAWSYGGRLADATNLLEQAEKNTPNDPTLLAALVLAYVHEGEIQKYTEALDRLTKIESEASRSASDHERLLVAFHKVFMSPDLVQLVEELDDIISRHDRWGLAYAIRAEAKTNLAKRTLSMAELESAREDAELAIRYHPDNVFVLTSAMNALVASIELGRNQHDISNDELRSLEARATEIAQQLTTRPDYLF